LDVIYVDMPSCEIIEVSTPTICLFFLRGPTLSVPKVLLLHPWDRQV
jgi:hypothetical protein